MIKALISDVARVLLFPKDRSYQGTLNSLHKEMLGKTGYEFFDHFEVNEGLIEFYKSLKYKLDLYIFTSETIQDVPELQPYWQDLFKKIYSASKMGVLKKDPESYKRIVKDLGLSPDEVIFVDDSSENIEAANSAGLQTIQYKDNEDLFSEIQRKLGN